jgi:hypothetical protein
MNAVAETPLLEGFVDRSQGSTARGYQAQASSGTNRDIRPRCTPDGCFVERSG